MLAIKVLLKHGQFTRSYYVLGHNRQWTTLLSIDLDFDADTMSAYANIFTQTSNSKREQANSGQAGHALFHPVEQCGGPLSRGPNGHYATLTEDKRRLIKARHKNVEQYRKEKAWLQILSKASDPETEADWIIDQIKSRNDQTQEKNAISIAKAADVCQRSCHLYG